MGQIEQLTKERDDAVLEVRKLRAEKAALTVELKKIEDILLAPQDVTTHVSQRCL